MTQPRTMVTQMLKLLKNKLEEVVEVEEVLQVQVEETSDVINACITNANTDCLDNVNNDNVVQNSFVKVNSSAKKNMFPDPFNFDFNKTLFKDMTLDVDDNPVGAFGVPHTKLHAKKHLQLVAQAFDVKRPGNFPKKKLWALIADANNKKDFDSIVSTKTPRKGKHCPFRLINILFSDKCGTAFQRIGDPVTKEQLDAGIGADKRAFWKHIEEAFAGEVNDNDNAEEFSELFCNHVMQSCTLVITHAIQKLRFVHCDFFLFGKQVSNP